MNEEKEMKQRMVENGIDPDKRIEIHSLKNFDFMEISKINADLAAEAAVKKLEERIINVLSDVKTKAEITWNWMLILRIGEIKISLTAITAFIALILSIIGFKK